MWKVKVVVVVSMAVMLLLPSLVDCVEKEPDDLASPSAMCSTSSGTESQPEQKKELTVELIHGGRSGYLGLEYFPSIDSEESLGRIKEFVSV